MRDIARDVGVDAALISRYFGSKDDLFLAALDSCTDGSTLMSGEKSEFGARVANEIVFEPNKAEKLKGMSIMLRSIGSAKAAEMVQTTCSQRFFGPLDDWLSGPDATVRARLLAGFIMGMSVSRELARRQIQHRTGPVREDARPAGPHPPGPDRRLTLSRNEEGRGGFPPRPLSCPAADP
nr:TetR family transcriptional regulator [uncultured Brevundimonas sp.]